MDDLDPALVMKTLVLSIPTGGGQMRGHVLMIAEDTLTTDLVGSVSICQDPELTLPNHLSIYQMFVKVSERRRGVATAMLNAVVELARGSGLDYEGILLGVAADNMAARACYNKFGFRSWDCEACVEDGHICLRLELQHDES